MRKLTTVLLAGAAAMSAPALAAPQAPATADTSTTTATTPESSPTAAAPAATSQTVAASANVAAGVTVKDTSGGTVGTIESVDGQYAVLATTKNKVRLPLSSFGKGADGPILAMTQAQVDAAAASAAAKTAKP